MWFISREAFGLEGRLRLACLRAVAVATACCASVCSLQATCPALTLPA